MIFIVILSLITLAIASTAAFFSIYGLAAIFSGVFWPVVFMGSALEAGKLATVSYMYRFKDNISLVMKLYLGFAVLILMFITSAGIFGYLSMGYQQDSIGLKQQQQQIVLIESEQVELNTFKAERIERKKQIDADIAALPNNFITGRQRLMKSYGGELNQLRNDIELYTTQIRKNTLKISELKKQKLITEVHTGPIIFIAKAFQSSTDDATKWMIVLIMFAFDPLAVALTLAVNNAITLRKEEEPEVVEEVVGKVKPIAGNITRPVQAETVLTPIVVKKEPELKPDLDRETIATLLNSLLGKHDLTEEELKQREQLESLLNIKSS